MQNTMQKVIEAYRQPTADGIADMADQGENISRFFTNAGKMTPPILSVNTKSELPMQEEGDGQEN